MNYVNKNNLILTKYFPYDKSFIIRFFSNKKNNTGKLCGERKKKVKEKTPA